MTKAVWCEHHPTTFLLVLQLHTSCPQKSSNAANNRRMKGSFGEGGRAERQTPLTTPIQSIAQRLGVPSTQGSVWDWRALREFARAGPAAQTLLCHPPALSPFLSFSPSGAECNASSPPPPCICSFPLRTAKWGMGKPPPPTRPQMCFLGPLLKIPRGSIFRIFTAIFASKSLPAEGKRIGPKETNDFWQWTKILLQKLPSLTPEKPLQNPQ